MFFSFSPQTERPIGGRQVTQISETGHLHIITLRNSFTLTKRYASSHFSQNSRHPQSNLHFSKWIRNMHRAKVYISTKCAIMIYANAIKLQSWGNINWKGKASNQFQMIAAKQKCRPVPMFPREAKNLNCAGQFSNFQSLEQTFCVMVGRVSKIQLHAGFCQ